MAPVNHPRTSSHPKIQLAADNVQNILRMSRNQPHDGHSMKSHTDTRKRLRPIGNARPFHHPENKPDNNQKPLDLPTCEKENENPQVDNPVSEDEPALCPIQKDAYYLSFSDSDLCSSEGEKERISLSDLGLEEEEEEEEEEREEETKSEKNPMASILLSNVLELVEKLKHSRRNFFTPSDLLEWHEIQNSHNFPTDEEKLVLCHHFLQSSGVNAILSLTSELDRVNQRYDNLVERRSFDLQMIQDMRHHVFLHEIREEALRHQLLRLITCRPTIDTAVHDEINDREEELVDQILAERTTEQEDRSCSNFEFKQLEHQLWITQASLAEAREFASSQPKSELSEELERTKERMNRFQMQWEDSLKLNLHDTKMTALQNREARLDQTQRTLYEDRKKLDELTQHILRQERHFQRQKKKDWKQMKLWSTNVSLQESQIQSQEIENHQQLVYLTHLYEQMSEIQSATTTTLELMEKRRSKIIHQDRNHLSPLGTTAKLPVQIPMNDNLQQAKQKLVAQQRRLENLQYWNSKHLTH